MDSMWLHHFGVCDEKCVIEYSGFFSSPRETSVIGCHIIIIFIMDNTPEQNEWVSVRFCAVKLKQLLNQNDLLQFLKSV